MKRLLAVICGLLTVPPLIAEERLLRVHGALSISLPAWGYDQKPYWNSKYSGHEGTPETWWRLQLGGAEPKAKFTFCWSHDDSAGTCVPDFASTDQYGNWTLTGIFDESSIGRWTEWIRFPSGAISNRITFSVKPLNGPSLTKGSLDINKAETGIFHIGQDWEMRLWGEYGPDYWGKPFDLCLETDGANVTCTAHFGNLDGNRFFTTKGTFSSADIGGKTMWAKFQTGAVSNRVVFTVDDGPLDNYNCKEGTIYPAGPMSGYTTFTRFMRDWYPKDSGEYSSIPNRTGGYGNTLEYMGCEGNNSVWLEWSYNGFRRFAVRAPWNGQTDRGLKIGDPLDKFLQLYPAAHHPLPLPSGLKYRWPQDLDVWDIGPLRVAFRKSIVEMMQVDWVYTAGADHPDQAYSTSTTIGPTDVGTEWK